MKNVSIICVAAVAAIICATSHADMLCMGDATLGDGTWIWYPGDYALWRGNDLQARRIEHGGGYPVFWATYAPHPLVDFVKQVNLDAPKTVSGLSNRSS